MMGTEFLKINAEMPEKIEVDAANPHLQIERMAKKCVCVFGANFNFNFLRHLCINFQNLCAHHEEEILRIPKHPQLAKFEFCMLGVLWNPQDLLLMMGTEFF